MDKYLHLIGTKHGRLTIISMHKEKRLMLNCVCSCGNSTKFPIGNISRTHSCGCYRRELPKITKTTHGKRDSKTYAIWSNMKYRCDNLNSTSYKYYGGRGITYCKEWNNFEIFLKDMGERPTGFTLDRIDVNGNYELSNCRWATNKEQMSNTTRNKYVVVNGEKITHSEAARRLGLKEATFYSRLEDGWTEEEAASLPRYCRNPRLK